MSLCRVVCLVLIATATGCGGPPGHPTAAVSPTPGMPSSTPSAVQPVGIPFVYGWDGVNEQLLLSGLSAANDGTHDDTTWTFSGSRWTRTTATVAIPKSATADAYGAEPHVQFGQLVYDSDRKRELYITHNYMMARPETWEWDGVHWTLASLANTPDLSQGQESEAYSPDLHEVVMISSPSMINPQESGPQQTWFYDGTSWTARNTAPMPGINSRVEYDPVHRSIVALSLLDFRTWRFGGNGWSPMPTTGVIPAPRNTGAVGFDPERGLWVVFGGENDGHEYNDTWTGDGSTWTLHAVPSPPMARHWEGGLKYLPYDTVHHRFVLFGGLSNGTFLGDTWAWDGNGWTQLAGPTYSTSAA